MNDNEKKLQQLSKQWVRENKKKLISEFCHNEKFPSYKKPLTIFMAGSPGAGKTEFSISLLQEFDEKFVRIDADEIREKMRHMGYAGTNAPVFQTATTKAVNILFDSANKKGQNVLLDGTFTYSGWKDNVERSVNKGRYIEIYYLHQDPVVAWNFVKERESKQGRAVPKEVFIDAYLRSAKNVNRAKDLFGSRITVNFVKNNYQKSVKEIVVDVVHIDDSLTEMYNRAKLGQILQ